MDDSYTKWYAVCSYCRWVAPLSDKKARPTEDDVRSYSYVAPTDICRVCGNKIIIILYKPYPCHIEEINNTPHGWSTEIDPKSPFHEEILSQIYSENDIDYWLRNPCGVNIQT